MNKYTFFKKNSVWGNIIRIRLPLAGSLQTGRALLQSICHSPSLVCLFILAVGSSPAQANFIPLAGGSDTTCRYDKQFNWDWPPPVPPADNLATGINWSVNLAGGANAIANSRNLTTTIRHTPGVCHSGEGPGPLFTFGPITATRPAGLTVRFDGEAQQQTHAGHIDVARAGVTTLGVGFPAGPEARVFVRAEHHGTPPIGFRLIASFRHPGITPNPFTVNVTPSYRRPNGTIDTSAPAVGPTNGNPITPGQRDTFNLPRTRGGNVLSNFTITGTGSGSTATTLAFLGLVDGTFSEMDMDIATLLFVDTKEFVVPYFFDSLIDLHVGIDLAEWFLDPPDYNFGDSVMFTNGINPNFHGVTIGTSEIYFDSNNGFVTDNPLTDNVLITAGIDGQVVPETPVIWLLSITFAIGLFVKRYRLLVHRGLSYASA